MDKRKIKQLRNRTLLTIFITIAIIGGLRTFDDVNRNNEILFQKNKQLDDQIAFLYYSEMDKIRKILKSNGEILANSKEVQKFILTKNREALYNFSNSYYSSIKNIFQNRNIMHFHLPDHTSFLRVHEKNVFGDNLKDIRPIITQTIETKKHHEGYEHGKHDIDMLTFRSTFPIFHQNKLIAVLELGIDTNYISGLISHKINDMYERETKIITIIKKGTRNFNTYGDFQGKFQNYVYKQDPFIEQIITKQQTQNDKNLITIDNQKYTLKWGLINFTNYSNTTIGSYLYIINTTQDIIQNKTFFYSSLAKPIIATIIILILISWIFSYFFKHFLAIEKRTRHILDTQSSLIILTNGEELLDCNGALLKFYGFETLEEFKETYDCICDSFEQGEGLLQKFTKDEIWIKYVMNNRDIIHKAAIKDKNEKLNIFNIVLDTYTLDDDITQTYFVVTLNNISDIEKANKQLIEQSKQASLGEMIGNIAHQWRQPLSSISTIASSIALRTEHNLIKPEEVTRLTDKVLENTKYLSETIDTFRNYNDILPDLEGRGIHYKSNFNCD